MQRFVTKDFKETQKLGESLAVSLRGAVATKQSRVCAAVLCLEGDLGGGKTTFLQGFAKGLGINEEVLSPTFVILKKFQIPLSVKNKRSRDFYGGYFDFEYLYHIDCYRLKNEKDILELNFKKIISDPKNIVAIEWPERIKKALPKNCIKIKFKFVNQTIRELVLS